MAIPVVQTDQSIIGFLQYQPFSVIPYATNSPTSWTLSAVPEGCSFNTSTGKLSGPCTTPGPKEIAFTAFNSDGPSVPCIYTLIIEPSSYLFPSTVVDVTIDLTSKNVSVTESAGDLVLSAEEIEDGKPVPLLLMKNGDDLLLNLRFTRAGLNADLPLTQLKFTAKEFETDVELFTANSFVKSGTGTETFYRIALRASSDALTAALDNYASNAQTRFVALCEFEWVETNSYLPAVGPGTLRGSSRTFGLLIPIDLNTPNS